MGVVIQLRATRNTVAPTHRPVPGDCLPVVTMEMFHIKRHGLAEMTPSAWARMSAISAQCLSCGLCPKLIAAMLAPPPVMVRRPGP